MMGEQLVDINVATVEDLETLVGVGRAKAEAIVKSRTSKTEFSSIEDLLDVPGIGRNLLEQNRGTLVCSIPGAAASGPQSRHCQSRRSLRRTSHELRLRSEPNITLDELHLSCDSSGGSINTNKLTLASPVISYTLNSNFKVACDSNDGTVCGSDDNNVTCDNIEYPSVDFEQQKPICTQNNTDSPKLVGGIIECAFVDQLMKNNDLSADKSDYKCLDKCFEVMEGTWPAFDNRGGTGGTDKRANINKGEEAQVEEEEDEEPNTISCDSIEETIPGCSVNNLDNTLAVIPSEIGDHMCEGELGIDTPHEDVVGELLPLHMQLSPKIQIHSVEDVDEEVVEEEFEDDSEMEDEQVVKMAIDLSSAIDKKQNKRKSDVCSDTKSVCPMKKSCKTVETSGGCTSGRRKASCLLGHKLTHPSGLKSWLNKFQTWTPAQKICALDSLIDICDLTQVRHIHQIILPQFQYDFISLLPKELALYVLSFLPPKDLLRAAQTCKYWNILAADNLLWREKCREAGIEDHMVVMDRRRKKGTSAAHMSPYKSAFIGQHRIEVNWRMHPIRPPRVLEGHDDHVITCLQFSGNTIVSGSDDSTLKVWSATTGKCMRTLTGHTGGVWSSQMAGNLIVSGSTDRTLRVWDAESGECIHTLYGHTSTVRCLHLHGNKVVSGSRDATLRLWDVTTGTCEHVLMGHVAAVRCVQYNGHLVVSGAYDYMVKVWNPDKEECIHTLEGHSNRVYSLQFDGIHIVSGSLDTSIRVWDVETGQCRHTLIGHQSLTSGMELKNNILISGNADSTVKVWDIVAGQCLQTLSGINKHRSAVTCLQFINKFVITSSDDGTVKLWDVQTGEFIRNLVALESGDTGGVVWRIRASNTKLVCAVGSRNGTEETKLLVFDFDVLENVK